MSVLAVVKLSVHVVPVATRRTHVCTLVDGLRLYSGTLQVRDIGSLHPDLLEPPAFLELRPVSSIVQSLALGCARPEARYSNHMLASANLGNAFSSVISRLRWPATGKYARESDEA